MTAMALACATVQGCGEGPPTAPSPVTPITLTISPNQLPFNGAATITADLIDAVGRPAANGTLVTFTTTLGSFESATAETALGRATVTFLAGTVSGTATINATAPNFATVPETARTIPIGTAAASRVLFIADPPSVPFSGGSAAITATVLDGSGKPLASIPVTFSSTAGTLTANALKTDQEGNAKTTLRTSLAATVTAAVTGDVSGPVANAPTGSASVTVARAAADRVGDTESESDRRRRDDVHDYGLPAANSGTAIPEPHDCVRRRRAANLGAASGMAIVRAACLRARGCITSASPPSIRPARRQPLRPSSSSRRRAGDRRDRIHAADRLGRQYDLHVLATVQPATVIVATYQWNFGDGVRR